MYKTWTGSFSDPEALSRGLEAHLNEFAGEVVTVAYAVSTEHHVLAVYRPIETLVDHEGAAVMIAEQIVDEAQL